MLADQNAGTHILKVPRRYQNNPNIINHRAWRFIIYLKDNAYPSLTISNFWNLFGLNSKFHSDVANHIHNALLRGRNFFFSMVSLIAIKVVIDADPSITGTARTHILNEIDYFLRHSEAGLNQYTGAQMHPLQEKLIEIFSIYMGRGNNPFNNREMTQLIWSPGTSVDLFNRQFIRVIQGQLRTEPTKYGIHNLIYHISESPRIPDVVKILSIAEIESQANRDGLIPDPQFNKEYSLYKVLSYIFTKDRPDLLPRTTKYFTVEGLSRLIDSNNKYLFGRGIDSSDHYFFPELGRMHSKVLRYIRNDALRHYGLLEITMYGSMVDKKAKMNLDLATPYRGKRSLYGFGFFDSRKSIPRNQRLKQETYNLDALTGAIVEHGVAHHIEYDKIMTEDDYLIWVDAVINLNVIRDPPKQRYFGEPIDFSGSPGAIEDMLTLRAAKEAFKQGLHAPHWGDKSHRYYNPEAIRRFYWNREMIQLYGLAWLDSLQSRLPIPSYFQPQVYLDAL